MACELSNQELSDGAALGHNTQMRILLAEDDAMIGEVVHDALRAEGHAADWVRDGAQALLALHGQHYDLVLLDLGLPQVDGLQVLQRLRGQGNAVALLILTARDGLDERLRGLDSGADDYLCKPFELDELLARMRAVLRRKGGTGAPQLGNGLLRLDPVTRQAQSAGQSPVQLTQREFALLQALLLRPGAILSRSALEDRIYGWGQEVESNAVEFLIHALRRKLGSSAIQNVRGVGWKVAAAA